MSLQDQTLAPTDGPFLPAGIIFDLVDGRPVASRSPEDTSRAAPFSVFVESPPDNRALLHASVNQRVVVMMGTQDLTAAPGRTLQVAATLRAEGHRIGLADVGRDPSSLAILPLLRPDIIEVDLGTIRQQPDWQAAQTLNAVSAYAEELPALVLATGIRTRNDRTLALGFGATLGTGPHFTDRQPRTTPADMPGVQFWSTLADPEPQSTPFSVAAATHAVRSAPRAQLAQTSHFLEMCAFDCDEATVVLSTFQKSNNLTPKIVELYSALSRNLAYVFAFTHPTETGQAAPTDIPHLRVRTFEPGHPLALEWNVIILNARYQAMLVARETPHTTKAGPVYEYILTHDRATILHATQTLVPLL